MSAVEVLKAARAAGIELALDGDDLALSAASAPPAAVLGVHASSRTEIMMHSSINHSLPSVIVLRVTPCRRLRPCAFEGSRAREASVEDPWEAKLADMQGVVEERKWDGELERYVVTNVHPVIIREGDQERVASIAILTMSLKASSPPDNHRYDAACKYDESSGLASHIKRQGHDQRRLVRGYFRSIKP